MKKFILMSAIGLSMAFAANAQKQGYVNVNELLVSLPAVDKAQNDLKTFAKSFEDAFATMQKEMETKYMAFQKDGKTMSEAVREVKQSELEALDKRMSDFRESSTKKISDKEAELMKPVYENINKAIKDYAVANNFDYIINAEGILYAKDSDNITKALITKMGGKPVSAAAPKPAGAK